MKESLRNIGTTMFILGAVMLAGVAAHELQLNCGEGVSDCMAAVSFGVPEYHLAYESDIGYSQTTTGEAAAYPSVFGELLMLIKTVGVYLVFLGVVTLVVLEILELHYIRKLLIKKRA